MPLTDLSSQSVFGSFEARFFCAESTAGYFFGNLPWVKENLDKIIWGAILIPGLLVAASCPRWLGTTVGAVCGKPGKSRIG